MDDHAETPPPGMRWAHTELGRTLVPVKSSRSRQTPHAALKHRCRNALTAFRQAHNLSVVLLPSYVGHATSASGQDIVLGKKGQADDTILIRFGSGYGVALAVEYKASYATGRDRQSDHQRRFQERWEQAGGVYVLCRAPADLTAVLTRLMAEHGGVF